MAATRAERTFRSGERSANVGAMNTTAVIAHDRISEAERKLQKMRGLLEDERSEEERELAVAPEDRGEDTTPSQHPADVASDLEQHEFTLTRELIDIYELRDVEEALARIAHGSYGICVDCGRPIPAERLEVRPQAARDVECERRFARRRKLG